MPEQINFQEGEVCCGSVSDLVAQLGLAGSMPWSKDTREKLGDCGIPSPLQGLTPVTQDLLGVLWDGDRSSTWAVGTLLSNCSLTDASFLTVSETVHTGCQGTAQGQRVTCPWWAFF